MVLRFTLADPKEVVLVEHSDDGERLKSPWLLSGARVINSGCPGGVYTFLDFDTIWDRYRSAKRLWAELSKEQLRKVIGLEEEG